MWQCMNLLCYNNIVAVHRITQAQYLQELTQIGYDEIKLERLDEHVFPGFLRWSEGHIKDLEQISDPILILKMRLIQSMVRYLVKYDVFHVLLVTAKK